MRALIGLGSVDSLGLLKTLLFFLMTPKGFSSQLSVINCCCFHWLTCSVSGVSTPVVSLFYTEIDVLATFNISAMALINFLYFPTLTYKMTCFDPIDSSLVFMWGNIMKFWSSVSYSSNPQISLVHSKSTWISHAVPVLFRWDCIHCTVECSCGWTSQNLQIADRGRAEWGAAPY